MRLTQKEIKAIIACFQKHFAPNDALWLFGSRADDSKRGGDIDLYIETHLSHAPEIANKQLTFLVDLKLQIGEQKIDIIINKIDTLETLPIYLEAKSTGVQLV